MLTYTPHPLKSQVLVGDSILKGKDTMWGPAAINKYLDEFSGQHLDNYAVIGSSMHDGWVKSVPEIYQDMHNDRAANMPQTVVLNGGGNDVISVRNDCWAYNDKCRKQIDSAMDIASGLMDKMAADGVQHVVYLGWYYVANMTAPVDYGSERLKTVCAAAPLDCHVADVRNVTIVTGFDGIHPNDAGYKQLAWRIWETKNAYNIPF